MERTSISCFKQSFLALVHSNSFIRYIWAGGIGFLVDLATLTLLHNVLGYHYQLATASGFILGLVVVYLICNVWVFEQRKMKQTPMKEFATFTMIGLIGLAFTHLLMWLLFGQLQWNITLAKCSSTAIILVWNYGARKIIIY